MFTGKRSGSKAKIIHIAWNFRNTGIFPIELQSFAFVWQNVLEFSEGTTTMSVFGVYCLSMCVSRFIQNITSWSKEKSYMSFFSSLLMLGASWNSMLMRP